jgi:thiamine kinase-like enzyme
MTLVHGDAKIANFCFADKRAESSPSPVAAVDFQYVGRGVGVKDVAYFLSSCLDERQLTKRADGLLDLYFRHLRQALEQHQPGVDGDELEREWRRLYPLAWADFVRFLMGWAPDHFKIHGYSKEMTRIALQRVDELTPCGR